MTASKRKTKKRYIIILAISLAIISAIAVKLYIDNETANHHIVEAEKLSQQRQNKIDSLSQKSYADELFIRGEYDSAMVAYKNIPNTDTNNVFVANRNQILDEMSSFQRRLKRQVASAEDQIDLTRNLSQMELMSIRSNFEQMTDSIQLTSNAKIEEMQQVLSLTKTELKQKGNLDRLVFRNNKGTQIRYFGEVENGMANGEGMGVHETGSVYEGEWRNNRKHGVGTYKWAEGEVYDGEFVEDRREGEGTYYWTNGNKYIGSWKNDKREGEGELFNADNTILVDGIWKNDEVVEDKN